MEVKKKRERAGGLLLYLEERREKARQITTGTLPGHEF